MAIGSLSQSYSQGYSIPQGHQIYGIYSLMETPLPPRGARVWGKYPGLTVSPRLHLLCSFQTTLQQEKITKSTVFPQASPGADVGERE